MRTVNLLLVVNKVIRESVEVEGIGRGTRDADSVFRVGTHHLIYNLLPTEFAGPLPKACQITHYVLLTLQNKSAIQAKSNSSFEHQTRARAVMFGISMGYVKGA